MSAFSRLASALRSLPSWAARYIDNRLAAIEDSIAGLASDGTFTMSSSAANKVVYVSAANTVALADADAAGKKMPVGITVSAPTGSTAVVRFVGLITGAGSFTAGALQYVSTTAGALTETAPAAPNATPIAIAINTTDLLVLGPLGAAFDTLRSVAANLGASLIGIQDAGAFTSAATVEAALAEIYQDLETAKLIVPVRLFGAVLAAGTPLAAFADNASSNPGVTLVNSKALGVRWNNNASQTAVWAEPIEIPYEADVSADATLRILCSKVGATVGDATTFTVTAFAGTVGQLHDADADFGGTSSAITGNATSKTVQQSTLTLTAANLAALAAPAFLSLSIKPTDGTLGTDDVVVHAVVVEFKRKLRTS